MNQIIQVRDDKPYIRDTRVTVGDIIADLMDDYQEREIIANWGHSNNGSVEITYEDISAAKAYALKAMGYVYA